MLIAERSGMAGTFRLVGDSGDCRSDGHHLGIFVPTKCASCSRQYGIKTVHLCSLYE